MQLAEGLRLRVNTRRNAFSKKHWTHSLKSEASRLYQKIGPLAAVYGDCVVQWLGDGPLFALINSSQLVVELSGLRGLMELEKNITGRLSPWRKLVAEDGGSSDPRERKEKGIFLLPVFFWQRRFRYFLFSSMLSD